MKHLIRLIALLLILANAIDSKSQTLEDHLKEGKIEIPFDTHDLSNGKYFIRLQTKDIVITKPVLITEKLKY